MYYNLCYWQICAETLHCRLIRQPTTGGKCNCGDTPTAATTIPSRSQHLTLEEIFRLVTDGNSVQINDSKTGEDITTRVLAQLILEQAPSKWAALPAELFHQIIRANDTLLQEFVDKYFHRALVAFEKSQHEFDQYMRHALGLSNGLLAMNPAA